MGRKRRVAVEGGEEHEEMRVRGRHKEVRGALREEKRA
jgi:hypothetical protein